MTNEKFDAWCREATKGIRYKPDRKAVYQELMDHLEERRDSLLAKNLSPTQATVSALDSMGSAQELAPQLAVIHRPWLGYLFSAVRFAAIVLLIISVLTYGTIGVNVLFDLISTRGFNSLSVNYGPLEYYDQPDVSDSSDGYLFRVSEVGMYENGDFLAFELEVLYWPWMEQANISYRLWAIDSNGNYYPSRIEAEYQDVPKVTTDGGQYSDCFGITSMKILEFDKTAQWVELHYDRDGRDIVLRIDLTGGDGL